MRAIKPYIGIILVFLLGASGGAATTYLLSRPHFETSRHGAPQNKEERLVRRLSEKLSLDSQQQQQVRVIIRDTHEKIQLVRQSMHPRIEAVMAEGEQRINEVLRPDQQQTFQRMNAERRERRERREHRH